jgi:hypothetical protein
MNIRQDGITPNAARLGAITGAIITSAGAGRQMQFGLRYQF